MFSTEIKYAHTAIITKIKLEIKRLLEPFNNFCGLNKNRGNAGSREKNLGISMQLDTEKLRFQYEAQCLQQMNTIHILKKKRYG